MVLSLDSKIEQLALEGRTIVEIAAILGRNPAVVRRDCQRLGVVPSRATTAMPYGISNGSLNLRMQLASMLIDMKLAGADISQSTGLSRRQITAASTRPYSHDWTLSQIERTLQHFDKTLKDSV